MHLEAMEAMEAISKKAAAVSFVTDKKWKERVQCDSALTLYRSSEVV
jgi:hypothetical protein